MPPHIFSSLYPKMTTFSSSIKGKTRQLHELKRYEHIFNRLGIVGVASPRFPPYRVGAARSRPLRRSRSTFNEPPSCVSFGRLRASPTWRVPILTIPYKAYAFNRVLPEIRDYGRLLAAPTGRIRSSGYFLKSGVTGGSAPTGAHPL